MSLIAVEKFKLKKRQKRKKVSAKELQEWNEIEEFVMTYQKYLTVEDSELKQKSKDAAAELLRRFTPLFNKYILMFKSGKINYGDPETKRFLSPFVGDLKARMSLNEKNYAKINMSLVSHNFFFVKETYGKIPEEEILTDLQVILLSMAARYRQTGKNFCAYVYNVFCYEVARLVKSFIKNVDNVQYKRSPYREFMDAEEDDVGIDQNFEDKLYENNLGLPDSSWIHGKNCSEIFADLTPIERKILVKYYMEGCNDNIIADSLGLTATYVNKSRLSVVKKIAEKLGKSETEIKRHRQCKTGKLFS